MGLFDQPYDPRGGERSQDYGDPLPRGKYVLEITASEERPTKDGGGAYLFTEHTVRSNHGTGRKVFHRFNLRNRSDKAMEIARKEFNSMLDAIGLGETVVRHPSQLLGKTFCGRVDVVPGQENRMDNEIKGFEPAAAFGAQAGAQASNAATPAWQQRPAGQAPAPAAAPAPWQQPQPAQAPAQAAQEQAPAAAPAATPAPAGNTPPWARRAAA